MQDPLQIWYGPLLNPAILQLPRIEFSLEGSPRMPWGLLLDEITRITGDMPGMWPQKPWYDQQGNGAYPFGNERLPHREWENWPNQVQLRKHDAALIVPTNLGDFELESKFSGSPEQQSFVNQLEQGVTITRWLLYSITEDVLLFLVAKEYSEWVFRLHQSLERHEVSAVHFCTCQIPFSARATT
jgi:hypothetical protein